MAVGLEHMRDVLLPGLWEIRGSYSAVPVMWEKVFAAPVVEEIALPLISPQAALAMGAIAVVIKNPKVSRRGLFSWFRE